MTPHRSVLGTLFRYELKMLLRDRRTIIVSIVLPVILFPLIILVSHLMEERRERELEVATYAYAVTGSQAAWARSLVARALALEEDSVSEELSPARFEERQVEDADSLLEIGELQLVVEGLSAEEPDSALPVVRLYYRGNSELSASARGRLRERLHALQIERRDSLLRSRGFPIEPEKLARVELTNVATPQREGGARLGLFLTPLVMFLMLAGGSIVAADAIAGEKERGTLETLLTTAARRADIVTSKQLTIIAVALAITLINVVNLLVYIGLGLFELPAGMAVSLTPATLIVLLLLFLPLTALVSSLLLALSGVVKTYKEYQVNFFPMFMLLVAISAVGLLPGMELRSPIVLVPLANVSVAVREVLVGDFDWIFLALTFAVTAGASAYATRLTSRLLSTERLITAAETDAAELQGGAALFPRRVLRWFGLLWVVLFLSSLWLGERLGVRGQVAFNLLGLFLGSSLLMIWRFHLKVREALALRPVRAPVWIAVLIGAPSAFLVGQGVFRVADYFFPVPERLLESFGQFLLPEQVPLWQIVLFLCVLPGVCEEIAFRGVLVHGLRRRFHPAVLCLVAGAIFGIFHVQLFRLIPTAYLGVVLTAVVLLTGSIFPAMVWHALNNAVALVPEYLRLWPEELPGWAPAAGAVGLALAFWILWRYGTPYPGLRRARGLPAPG